MRSISLCVIALCSSTSAAAAQAPGWPGFRGPTRDGIAHSAEPPTTWSDSENIVWKTELPGPAASSPVVVGDRIYVTCYGGYGVGDDYGEPEKLERHLVCVAGDTGEVLWHRVVPGPLAKPARRVQLSEHGFASPTPVTDGERIYLYFGAAGAFAFDLDGAMLWKRGLGVVPEDGPTATNQVVRNGAALSLRWGSAASPLLHEGLLIINASEQSNSIRALDAATGELRWKRESPNLEGCATSPMIAGEGEGRVLVIGLAGEVWGLAPMSGDLLWSVETGTRGGMSPTPVADARRVYTFGGEGKSFALRLAAGEGDRVAWQSANTDVPSPVLHEDHLLVVDQQGFGVRIRAEDGEVVSKKRLPGRTGKVYASPVLAGGRLYVTSRERGTFVYSVDGEFELLARNVLESDESRFNASPAIVGRRIFLRSNRLLYCISEG